MQSIKSHHPIVGPNATLSDFARRELLSSEEWEDVQRVADAKPPKSNPVWHGSEITHVMEEASPEYRRQIELTAALLARFEKALGTGKWEVTAIPDGEFARQSIATELLTGAKSVSFWTSSIGGFRHVELAETLGDKRYEHVRWLIEKICEVIPPKQGVGKVQIKDLADGILSFDVRDDIFKVAWAYAKIPEEWRKPGR